MGIRVARGRPGAREGPHRGVYSLPARQETCFRASLHPGQQRVVGNLLGVGGPLSRQRLASNLCGAHGQQHDFQFVDYDEGGSLDDVEIETPVLTLKSSNIDQGVGLQYLQRLDIHTLTV